MFLAIVGSGNGSVDHNTLLTIAFLARLANVEKNPYDFERINNNIQQDCCQAPRCLREIFFSAPNENGNHSFLFITPSAASSAAVECCLAKMRQVARQQDGTHEGMVLSAN